MTLHKKNTKADLHSEGNRWMLAALKVNKLILKDEANIGLKNFPN